MLLQMVSRWWRPRRRSATTGNARLVIPSVTVSAETAINVRIATIVAIETIAAIARAASSIEEIGRTGALAGAAIERSGATVSSAPIVRIAPIATGLAMAANAAVCRGLTGKRIARRAWHRRLPFRLLSPPSLVRTAVRHI